MPDPKITVVANGVYPVTLDSGRHLHPGEIDEVKDTSRHRRLVTDRQLRLAPERDQEPKKPTTQKVAPAGAGPQTPEEKK